MTIEIEIFDGAPRWARHLCETQQTILERMNQLMALVQVEQADLDNVTSELSGVADALQAEINTLNGKVGTPLHPADLTGIQSQITRLQGLEVPAAPADTTPPAEATAPAADAAGGPTPPPETTSATVVDTTAAPADPTAAPVDTTAAPVDTTTAAPPADAGAAGATSTDVPPATAPPTA